MNLPQANQHNKQNITIQYTGIGMAAIYATVTCATVLLSACGQDKKAPSASNSNTSTAVAPALTVKVAKPVTEAVPQTIKANGTILPWQEASVGAEVSGLRVASVLVNVGDVVKKGQTLATFTGPAIEADVLQTKASVAEAEINYNTAKDNAARYQQLADTKAVSQMELNQALATAKAAKARVDALQAGLAAQMVRRNNLSLTASDFGTISARNATVGAVVQPGAELFKLIRQNKLEWVADVTPNQITALKVGMPVVVGADDTVTGSIRAFAPQVDAKKKTIAVYVSLPSNAMNHAQFVAGLSTVGNFKLGEKIGLTVPTGAVTLKDGQNIVYVLKAGNRVAATPVQTGGSVAGKVQVVSGISASDIVVIDGAGFLNDGDTVNVVSQ